MPEEDPSQHYEFPGAPSHALDKAAEGRELVSSTRVRLHTIERWTLGSVRD